MRAKGIGRKRSPLALLKYPCIVAAILAMVWCRGVPAQNLPDASAHIYSARQLAAGDSLIHLRQWRVEDGGNGHWYAVLANQHTWQEADSIAGIFMQGSLPGYLATITTGTENTFIRDSVIANTDQPSIENQFYLGGEYIDGTWVWSDGENFCGDNWALGEPNNIGVENVLSMWGYNEPYQVPGTWNNTLRTDSTNADARFWAVIEWGEPVAQTTICGDSFRDCGEECDGSFMCTSGCVVDCSSATAGDVNLDGKIDVRDALILVVSVFKSANYLFTCFPAADANADHSITSADIIVIVNYVFRSGPAPASMCETIAVWGETCP